MTNKEAIRVLKSTSVNLGRRGGRTAYVEALEMAITALQAQDKLQDIEYMCRLNGGADYFNAFRAISAHPETCDTCKHGYFGDEQCNDCRVRFTSHYERRNDGSD